MRKLGQKLGFLVVHEMNIGIGYVDSDASQSCSSPYLRKNAD
jgi:hypothetical protein